MTLTQEDQISGYSAVGRQGNWLAWYFSQWIGFERSINLVIKFFDLIVTYLHLNYLLDDLYFL